MDSLFEALNRSADGAYVIDGDQRIVFWNAAAERLLGYRSDEVVGRPCHEVIQGSDDDNRAWCRLRCKVAVQANRGEAVDAFTMCAQASQGATRWINVSIVPFPIPSEDGRLVVHLFRDGTVQKQQEVFSRQILAAVQNVQPTLAPDDSERASADIPILALTDREAQVLELMAHGRSTGEIAVSLSISVSTTRNHIQNILQKLNVHSRSQAVAYAFEHGLVSHP